MNFVVFFSPPPPRLSVRLSVCLSAFRCFRFACFCSFLFVSLATRFDKCDIDAARFEYISLFFFDNASERRAFRCRAWWETGIPVTTDPAGVDLSDVRANLGRATMKTTGNHMSGTLARGRLMECINQDVETANDFSAVEIGSCHLLFSISSAAAAPRCCYTCLE